MGVLEQLHRQQKAGEAVVEGRHNADVGRLKLSRDALEGHRLGGDVDALGVDLGGQRRQTIAIFARAAYTQLQARNRVPQPLEGSNERLDAEAGREAPVVEHPQRPVIGPGNRLARWPEHALVG